MRLVFDPFLGGHHTDFIRYTYNGIPEDFDEETVFVVGHGFSKRCPELIASGSEKSVRWDELSDAETKHVTLTGRAILDSFRLYRLLLDRIKRYNADVVVILELTHLEWALTFFSLPVPLRTILFVQYPEMDMSSGGRISRLRSRLKFWVKEWKTSRLLKLSVFERIFLLNGEHACTYLNKRFPGNPAIFHPLPDPAPAGEVDSKFNVKEKYAISEHKFLFLAFGELSKRKGIDLIVDALHVLGNETLSRIHILIAGARIAGRDQEELQSVLCEAAVQFKDSLTVDIRFVPDGELGAMFAQSDCVLMPYRRSEYSSGALVNASSAGTPVLGPDSGVLGNLIQQYQLGAITRCEIGSLAESMEQAVVHGVHHEQDMMAAFVRKSNSKIFSESLWGL
jgi:glycosyltransferase involved in cell wall biosynthesis